MPKTYLAQDGLDIGVKLAMGVPLDSNEDVRARVCDMVSSKMWTYYPWATSKKNIAAGSIPLVDSTQDYAAPTDCYRLTKVSLNRTSTTPNESRELDVAQELDVNLRKSSPYGIRVASLQAGVNMIRLECAVQISSGEVWEIDGEYQQFVTKITALTDALWFDDQYLEVFAKGVAYWALRFADDPRAGEVTARLPGNDVAASGMLGEFYDGLRQMRAAEDFSGVDGIFPGDAMGTGRDDLILNIFGVT